MVNNFSQIATLLEFNSEDEFYFCQIIKRKKENPELGSNNVVVHSYYIGSIEQLLNMELEIKMLCELHNARAYINLNRCSYERIAWQTMKNVCDRIQNREYRTVKRAYNTCCGQFTIENPKRWLIDIDIDVEVGACMLIQDIENHIDSFEPEGKKLIAVIPTKNGYHMITKPFNMQKFNERYANFDVHKNNPTILYAT